MHFAKKDFNFIPMKIYTGEDLKLHTAGVLCFKSLPISHH